MNKHLRRIIMILILLFISFGFVSNVSAGNKRCVYRGNKNGVGTFGMGTLDIINPSNSSAKVRFRSLIGPDLTCNGWEDVGYYHLCAITMGVGCILGDNIWTNRCSLNTNKVSNTKTKDYSKAASGVINTSVTYMDANKKFHTEPIPNINLGDSCPKYLMVVVTDTSDADNVQAFAGDENTKTFLSSKVSQNSSYNFMITGTKYKTKSEASDPNKEEEPLDTCDGLLGTRVDGEYAADTMGALLQQIFDYMKLAVIAMIFIFSTIDYAKALSSNDSDEFKKANMKLLKRFIIGVIFFLIPTIVDIVLGIIDSSTCGIK